MKKMYSLSLLLILFIANSATAQNDCSTPYPISSDAGQIFSLATGIINNDSSNDYGCLTTHDNATWLYFQLCQPGVVEWDYGATSSSHDVDYIVYGPLTSPAQCGLDSSLIVTCGNTITGSGFLSFNAPAAGAYYKIMIANSAGSTGTFSLSPASPFNTAVFDTICTCTILPAVQPVCQVTTDPAVNHNIVIWEKDPAYLYEYIIQRETTTMGVYSTIATVMNSDTSVYEDPASNPMVQSFKYRILATDSCGQFTPSTPHSTIHLLTTAAFATGYPQLSWNQYVGFGYSTYFIYRGNSPATLALYDSISASFTTYTDVAPAAGMVYYAVAVFPPSPCQPSRAMNHYSLSNVTPFLTTGIANGQLSNFMISPNPATNELTIDFGKNMSTLNITIYDVAGKPVKEGSYSNVSSAKLDVSAFANGYYIIRLLSDKGVAQRNIIISK
jgi:hypothetical protein